MPIYEYQCESCHQTTEAIQRMDDPPLQICPHCGGPLRKRISAPAFQFKGTGWYVTDYAGKGKKGEGAETADAGAKTKANGGGADSGGSAKEGGASAKSDDTTSTASS